MKKLMLLGLTVLLGIFITTQSNGQTSTLLLKKNKISSRRIIRMTCDPKGTLYTVNDKRNLNVITLENEKGKLDSKSFSKIENTGDFLLKHFNIKENVSENFSTLFRQGKNRGVSGRVNGKMVQLLRTDFHVWLELTREFSIIVNDMIFDSYSKNIYLSVSAKNKKSAVFEITPTGKIAALDFNKVKHMTIDMSAKATTFLDMQCYNETLYISTRTSKSFKSAILMIPTTVKADATIPSCNLTIYHGNHRIWESHAPAETFTISEIKKTPYFISTTTCTPLVMTRLDKMKPNAKIKGTTIAELGEGNIPFNIISYTKNQKHYVLTINSEYGVIKTTEKYLLENEKVNESSFNRNANPEIKEMIILKDEKWQNVLNAVRIDEERAVVLTMPEAGDYKLSVVPLP